MPLSRKRIQEQLPPQRHRICVQHINPVGLVDYFLLKSDAQHRKGKKTVQAKIIELNVTRQQTAATTRENTHPPTDPTTTTQRYMSLTEQDGEGEAEARHGGAQVGACGVDAVRRGPLGVGEVERDHRVARGSIEGLSDPQDDLRYLSGEEARFFFSRKHICNQDGQNSR